VLFQKEDNTIGSLRVSTIFALSVIRKNGLI
jgi:hypothetical protein